MLNNCITYQIKHTLVRKNIYERSFIFNLQQLMRHFCVSLQPLHHNHHPAPFYIDSTWSEYCSIFRDFVAIFIWYRSVGSSRPRLPIEGLSARVIGQLQFIISDSDFLVIRTFCCSMLEFGILGLFEFQDFWL